MMISSDIVVNRIEIWQPRWHDKVVLIAKHKVHEHNAIIFTKTPSWPDIYYLSAEQIKKFPLDSNGKIACYAVPLSELERLEFV